VVPELYFTFREAGVNFANWWLYAIHDEEIDSKFILFSDEAWF
jgi:hypothetical protein